MIEVLWRTSALNEAGARTATDFTLVAQTVPCEFTVNPDWASSEASILYLPPIFTKKPVYRFDFNSPEYISYEPGGGFVARNYCEEWFNTTESKAVLTRIELLQSKPPNTPKPLLSESVAKCLQKFQVEELAREAERRLMWSAEEVHLFLFRI